MAMQSAFKNIKRMISEGIITIAYPTQSTHHPTPAPFLRPPDLTQGTLFPEE
jgi:hypothetical protein